VEATGAQKLRKDLYETNLIIISNTIINRILITKLTRILANVQVSPHSKIL